LESPPSIHGGPTRATLFAVGYRANLKTKRPHRPVTPFSVDSSISLEVIMIIIIGSWKVNLLPHLCYPIRSPGICMKSRQTHNFMGVPPYPVCPAEFEKKWTDLFSWLSRATPKINLSTFASDSRLLSYLPTNLDNRISSTFCRESITDKTYIFRSSIL
jgi:hypothetical protein